jgi:hypothetical protein
VTAATRFQTRHSLGVELNKLRPLSRDVPVGEDRRDRTLGHAPIAVDALLRINIELHLVLVKAIARTHHYAVGVLAIMTGFTNNIRHEENSFPVA